MSISRRRLLAAAGIGLCGPVGAQTEQVVEAGAGRILVQMEPGFDVALQRAALAWVARSAAAVSGYLGRFPMSHCELLLQRVAGAGVKGGSTFAQPEPYMRVRLGEETTVGQLADDWVLVHEMVHLAIPRVPRSQNWLHEGLATYVEGVARVQAGLNTAPRLWAEMVRGMPRGQPAAGDLGLDHTPTWGRTYWGGALFCLLADVHLLQRSQARVGLRQALRGVLDAGGSYAVAWPVRRVLEAADGAVQQHTLIELYEAMKDSSTPVPLADLWRALGVTSLDGTEAALDDAAPLAAVRRAIA